MKNKTFLFVISLITLISAISCNKSKQAKVSFYLTDDPGNYQAVNIDIRELWVNTGNTEAGSWTQVTIKPGVYNLLDFRNGMDTLLGTLELPTGNITQMRLVLGTNNSVTIDDQSFELTTPSAQQSGLKFNASTEIKEGIDYKIWIDFDAGKSVVKAGASGKYILKPVIKAITEAQSGAVSGIILPAEANSWVYLTSGSDTVATAKPNLLTGYFLIRGIPAGSYNLIIDGETGFIDQTINVSVSTGDQKNIGIITLLK